ncbi:MAG: hypothetical protein HW384_939, partial [Dehalococcoidia bacterium]|nr:hypothetical protein [Dehalococcoidia bacterium]
MRVAITEMALGSLIDLCIKGSHPEGAGPLACLATGAFFDIHYSGISWRHSFDCPIRASIHAGYRVRALPAGILNDAVVAIDTFSIPET